MNIFSNLKNPFKDRSDNKGDQAKALERTYEHYKLFKKDSDALKEAIPKAGFSEDSPEYTDYMNYFDQMNKAYVKTALDTFVDPSFDKTEMKTYSTSESKPLGKTEIDPAKYYEIHSAVVSKSTNEDLKNTLPIFKAEVRKKNKDSELTSKFDTIDNPSNNSSLNQKEKDNISAIAAVHKKAIVKPIVEEKISVPLNKDIILAIAAVHQHINQKK